MSLTPEVEAVLSLANDKLKSAKILLKNKQYSDAASRAYYCAFHAISAILLSRDMSFSSHTQTIGAFNREFVKTELFPSYFGKRLVKMQMDREAGDYRTHSPIGKIIALEDVKMAEEILGACRQFLEKEKKEQNE